MDIMEMIVKAIVYGVITGATVAGVLNDIKEYFKNHKQ